VVVGQFAHKTRQVRSLALPTFLASAASTTDLQSQILLASACTADTQFDTYLADWQAAHGPLSPSDPLPVKQSVWDKPGILSSSTSVESAISDSCQKAIRFLAAAAPHSGDWLLALPVTACGLRLTLLQSCLTPGFAVFTFFIAFFMTVSSKQEALGHFFSYLQFLINISNL